MKLPFFSQILVCILVLSTFQAHAQESSPTHPLEVAIIYKKIKGEELPVSEWISENAVLEGLPEYVHPVMIENEKIFLENLYKNAGPDSRILAFDEAFLINYDEETEKLSFQLKNQTGMYHYFGKAGFYAVQLPESEIYSKLQNLSFVGRTSEFSSEIGLNSLAAELYIQPRHAFQQIVTEENGTEQNINVIDGQLVELRLYDFELGTLVYAINLNVNEKSRLEKAYIEMAE